MKNLNLILYTTDHSYYCIHNPVATITAGLCGGGGYLCVRYYYDNTFLPIYLNTVSYPPSPI